MDQPQKPVAPRGGRVVAKIAAVLLALGVLGYLMWRSQGGDDRVEDSGEYLPIPPVGDWSSLPPLPQPRPTEEELRAWRLFSSKSMVIEPPAAHDGTERLTVPRRSAYPGTKQDGADQEPEGKASDVAPEPEAPR